jgi:hypothetical protein
MSNWPDGLWTRRSRIGLPPRTSYSSGFASSILHPCGTNVPRPSSGQDRQDTVQSPTAVCSKVLSGKGILKSHWPTKLSGRSSPTREVVPSTSSTSLALQMETTPGPSVAGNSPFRILVKRSLEILGVRDSSQSGGVVTSTPSQTLHVHRRVQFRLGSPCERGRFIHEGHVVPGGVQGVHLGTCSVMGTDCDILWSVRWCHLGLAFLTSDYCLEGISIAGKKKNIAARGACAGRIR